MRRMFAMSGTVFMLRCITMFITSLSVPGKHLDCHPRVSLMDIFTYKQWMEAVTTGCVHVDVHFICK